jgi:hypothetical protein
MTLHQVQYKLDWINNVQLQWINQMIAQSTISQLECESHKTSAYMPLIAMISLSSSNNYN